MLNRISYRLSKCFLWLYRPRMIQYKKDFQNQAITHLRIGNTTFIDHAENLKLGNHVYIGHHNFIEASNGIEIEDTCQITSFVSITTHSSHHSIRLYGSNYGTVKDHVGYVKGQVFIGKCTFVGPHVTIMPGSKIGEGSIVSAYAFVKGEFPPFSIIAGNPAKVVGSTKEIDEKFLSEHPELKKFYMQ